MIRFSLLIVFISSSLSLGDELRLAVGRSELVQFKTLSRVAVSDGRKLRARALPPGEVLVTGLREGVVTLRLWGRDGSRAVYDVYIEKGLSDAGMKNALAEVSLEFLEMNRTKGDALGLKPPDRMQFQAGAIGQGASGFSGLNYSFQVSTPGAWLKMLRQSGWAKVLAAPELSVRLGEEATFHSGGEIPVTGETESYGRVQRQVQWKPFGITVRIRPESADGVHFYSDIKLEISEVGTGTRIEGVPPFTRRRLETKVNSQDRETVFLSGLTRQAGGHDEQDLPGFGAIPILGRHLFGSTEERRSTSEILMAMTVSLRGRTPQRERLENFRERFDGLDRSSSQP